MSDDRSSRGTSASRRVVHLGLVLGLASLLLFEPGRPDVPRLAIDMVFVPGGVRAITRIVGPASFARDGFLPSLNRVLLARPWDSDEAGGRNDIIEYVETITALRQRFGVRIEFRPNHRMSRRMFAAVCADAGMSVHQSGEGLVLDPMDGSALARRRRYTRALGWDLQDAAQRLAGGEKVVLEIPEEEVPAPIPLARWNRLVGPPVPITRETALAAFVRDAETGRLFAALERLQPELVDRLGDDGLAALRPVAGLLLRYADSFRVDGPVLVTPGGQRAAAEWAALVGASPDNPREFIPRLLTFEEGRAAWLWHELAAGPPEVVAAVFEGVRSKETPLRRMYAGLVEVPAGLLMQPTGNVTGLSWVLHAVRRDTRNTFDLPGGNAAWLAALEQPGTGTVQDVVAAVIRSRIRLGNVPVFALPAVVRALELFERRPAFATADRVAPVLHAVAHYPFAKQVLLWLPENEPQAVNEYLGLLDGLAALPADPEAFALQSNFEGGIETLRRLARAGKVDPAGVVRLFRRWIAIHAGARKAKAVGCHEVLWLAELAKALPEAAAGAPGRGPAERAWLGALVPLRDPQCFHWNDLDVCGTRSNDTQAAMLQQLEAQRVPSLDQWLGIAALLAPAQRDATAPGRAQAAVQQLPLDPGERYSDIERAFLGSSDRPELARLLGGSAADVGDACGPLAVELRTFLLAPAFLEELSRSPRFLVGHNSSLIHDHTVIRHFDHQLHAADPFDVPWQLTRFSHGGRQGTGARTVGHLAGIGRVLALLQFTPPPGDRIRHRQSAELARGWYPLVLETNWGAMDDALLPGVVAAEQAGAEILAAARESKPHRALVSSVLGDANAPATRLDRVRLALAAASDPAHRDLLSGPRGQELLSSNPATLAAHMAASLPPQPGRLADWLSGRSGCPATPAFEYEGPIELLQQRLYSELWVAVTSYMARHKLPAQAGQDLSIQVLHFATSNMEIESVRDWQRASAWIERLDDNVLDGLVRQCIEQHWYSARF